MDRNKQKWTEMDRNGRKQMETDRTRQKQTETDKKTDKNTRGGMEEGLREAIKKLYKGGHCPGWLDPPPPLFGHFATCNKTA